jgi:putative transcriptional regulator
MKLKIRCKLAVLMAQQDPPLTQKKLAEELGLGSHTVHRLYTNDFTRIDTQTIEKLCGYFRCGLSDLFELKEISDAAN